MYECRVVDYDMHRKLHKVIYDADSSIEEVNLARRKFNPLDPTPAEAAEGSIIGLKIGLPPRSIDGKDDLATTISRDHVGVVVGVVEPENSPPVENADDRNRVLHRVLYLANEYVAEVNLNRTKYFVLDTISNKPLRTVNETLELVELDPVEELNVSEQVAAQTGLPKPPPDDKVVGNTLKSNAAKAPTNLDDTQPKIANVNPQKSTDTDQPPLSNTPRKVVQSVAASTEDSVVVGPSAPAQASTAIPKSIEPPPANSVSKKNVHPHITEVIIAESSKPEFSDPSEKNVQRMAIDTEAGAPATKKDINVQPAVSANGTQKSDPSSNVQKPDTARTSNTALTAESLSLLDATAPGSDKNAVIDEDTKTISDGDDKWIEASANAVKNPEDLKSKFIMLKCRDGDRIAYVEDYLSNGTHFIAFQDKQGGNMQMLLTTENFRLLSDDEVDKMSSRVRKRATPINVLNSGAEETPKSSKRRRSAVGSTPQSEQKPLPGGDLIGKVVSLSWPGNGGNYLALVVGFQQTGSRRRHKVYYVEDESTEVVDLTKRDWVCEASGPWDLQGLVGKRLYVYWEGTYDENEMDQKRSEEKFGKGNSKVPFEAFVVKFISQYRYRLLYTQDDNLEDRDLTQEDDAWDVLEGRAQRVDGLPLISWTGPISN